jgi:hypothetical protein
MYVCVFQVISSLQKSYIFWNITPCCPLKVNRLFGGTFNLDFQGRRISQGRNQRDNIWQAKTSVDFQRTLLP